MNRVMVLLIVVTVLAFGTTAVAQSVTDYGKQTNPATGAAAYEIRYLSVTGAGTGGDPYVMYFEDRNNASAFTRVVSAGDHNQFPATGAVLSGYSGSCHPTVYEMSAVNWIMYSNNCPSVTDYSLSTDGGVTWVGQGNLGLNTDNGAGIAAVYDDPIGGKVHFWYQDGGGNLLYCNSGAATGNARFYSPDGTTEITAFGKLESGYATGFSPTGGMVVLPSGDYGMFLVAQDDSGVQLATSAVLNAGAGSWNFMFDHSNPLLPGADAGLAPPRSNLKECSITDLGGGIFGIHYDGEFADGDSDEEYGFATADLNAPVHNVTQGLDYFTVQAAIDGANPGNVITVDAGTYAERLNVHTQVDLRGAQYGVDPTGVGARTNPALESVVTEAGLSTPNPDVLIDVPAGGAGTTIDGFTLNGDPTNPVADTSTLRVWADNVTIGNNIIDGKYGILFKGSDNITAEYNRVVANKTGITVQPLAASNVTITGNSITLGSNPLGDESAMYIASCDATVVYGNTATGFVNGKGIAGSSCTNTAIAQNVFTGNKDGVSFWGSTIGLGIEYNDLSNNSRFGVSVKGQGIDIAVNSITNNGDTGINVDRHVIDTEEVQIDGNDLSGNVNFGVKVNTTLVTELMDASGNYWGTTDAAAVKALANNGVGVDYTPWVGGGTAQNPGFEPVYTTLYVDDDSPQVLYPGYPITRIHESFDFLEAPTIGNPTVNVMDGTYGAFPTTGVGAYIEMDDVHLLGQSQSGTIIDGAIGGVGSSASYWPKGIHVQAEDVLIQNFTVRGFTGDMMSTGGYGIVHRDWDHDEIGEGYVFYDGCTVENVTVEDCYSGIYALCFTNLTVSDCLVQNNYSDGMFIARGSDYATVDGNTVLNSGDHGIWVGYSWTTTTPSDHAVITDNYVDGAREGGISFVGSDDATITGNTITNVAAEGWSVGALSIKDGSSDVSAQYNLIYGNDGTWNGHAGTGHGIGIDGTPSGIDLTWNTVYGNAGDGCHNYSTVDVDARECWWGDASGPGGVGPGTGDEITSYVEHDPWIGMAGSENVVCDPTPLILNVASLPNDPDGTIAVEYLGGGGGAIYGYSVTFSWGGAVAGAVVGDVTEGALLSDAGSTQFFVYSSGTDEITVDCVLLGAMSGVFTPGTMFTIGFDAVAYGATTVDITLVAFRDNNNNPLSGFFEDDGEIQVDITNPSVTGVELHNDTLTHTDDYAKDHDHLYLTAVVTDDYPLVESDIKADVSTLLVGGGTAVPPFSYNPGTGAALWHFFNVTLTADGAQSASVNATDGLGNVGTGSDDIIVDNTPPGKVTGFAAAPAHEEGILSWDDPTSPSLDTNYYGIVVRYTAWGDYPYYDPPPPPPAYPPTHTAGDDEAFDDTGVVTGGVHAIVPRDIHYYSAFAYDWALNYGTVDAGGQDRCTNYWLGDVTTSLGFWDGYNGLVNPADIDKLAGNYGSPPPAGVPGYAECDVGPSHDNTRVGVPEPDDMVQFEDMMIFAMNYGVVAPRVVPFLPDESTKALSLELAELGVIEDGLFEVALRLEGNASEVKGLSTVIAYGSSELEFVNARLSDDMSSPLAPVFFWHGSDDSSVQIDLAVLGTDVTVGGSGEVAVMTFRALSDEYTLEFDSADLRGANNEALSASFEGIESRPETPASYRLVGNLPNPFNPMTKVAYQVPHESHVSIRVYDVSGRLVRTLLDNTIDPGHHEVAWDGRNDRGESVGSGVYFCTMEADAFHGSHKMMLLK